jgi:SAM-dependent methyltransferase
VVLSCWRSAWSPAPLTLVLSLTIAAGGLLTAQTGAPVKPDVVYIPTPQPVVEAMLDLAQVSATDVVYDLGSGDGRIVITAARKYGARAVGVEIDPERIAEATRNAAAAGVADRVRFVQQNIFAADIHEATVVTLYLLQSLNERIRPKLVRELRPGSRIVSHVFNMGPEWPPARSVLVDRSPVFLWTVPER